MLGIFRIGNTIPIAGIDQEALRALVTDLANRNSLLQSLNMYSGSGGKTILSSFALGIIPFINASIVIDLFTTVIPTLEKLQNEEGEKGRKTLMFYKKILTVFFALLQSIGILYYIRSYL